MRRKCVLRDRNEGRPKTADVILYKGETIRTCFGHYDSFTGMTLPECEKCYWWERNWREDFDHAEGGDFMKPVGKKEDA